MKKISVIFILFLIVILTGCSGTYTLNINKDLTVDEEVSLNVKNSNDSKNRLEKLFENNDVSKDNYSIKESDNNLKISYKKHYTSVEEYVVESKLYKQLFNDVSYSNDSNSLVFNTSTKFKLDSNTSSENITNDYNISLLNIDVNTPLKVEHSNSDYNEGDTMRWVLDENTREKQIDVSILLSDNEIPKLYIVLLIFVVLAVVVSIVYFVRKFLKSHKMN